MRGDGLFSVGADRLLQEIRGYSKDGTALFPRNLDTGGARRQPDETVHHWFRRLVDDYADSRPKACAVEDNIAVFAALQWRHMTLTCASIQVIVARCDLDDFYLADPADPADARYLRDAQYLRLDLDYETLGDLFSHPLPHVHVGEGFSARFALDGGNSGNIVADFIEFIYRHHVPLKWRRWAEREWNRHFAALAGDEDDNPLPRILEAFDSNQFDILKQMSRELAEIRTVLRHRKDSFFALRMDGSDRELIEYPSAR
ncbi:MAG: hypothetical protein ABR915_11815 [Thermoguttaceae bacterium]|jgi:hypothetical protein